LPPSRLEYDWVSKHIGVQIKEVFQNSAVIPSPRMGTWLTGLRHQLAEYDLADTRNLVGDSEAPPVHEIIQLNSHQSDDFLVDGIMFLRGKRSNFAIKLDPIWGGLAVTVYTAASEKAFNRSLLERTWEWARANNFLKGEAFALSGEFLPRTEE